MIVVDDAGDSSFWGHYRKRTLENLLEARASVEAEIVKLKKKMMRLIPMSSFMKCFIESLLKKL
jgi:hypothetical protein